METFAVVFCWLSAIIALCYFYLSWNFNFWEKRGVKGPKPKLIFGSFPCVIKRNRSLAFEIQELYEKYKKSGERFIGVFMTRNPRILVTDPSLAREILVTNFKSFRNTEAAFWANKHEDVAPRNPFMNSGLAWKEKRSMVVGGLSPNRIKKAYPIVMEICKKLTDFVAASNKINPNKIEIKTLSYKFAIEIIADFVWGINADALKIDEIPNQMLELSRRIGDNSFAQIDFFNLSGLAPLIRKIIPNRFYPEESDNFFSQVQKKALEMRTQNKCDRLDFINYLIQLQEKKNIGHMDMVGHSLTILQDGFETTASVLFHALYYLANNKSAQIKLREEIVTNADENGCLSYDSLMQLPYLDQCVDETIRNAAVVTLTSRICSEETYLKNRENQQVKIEPGMIVDVAPYSIHHDSEIYPNPTKYIPERFDNNRAKELKEKGYFFPFGAGPRICPGMRLGLLEVKAGIAEIIKNFDLKNEDSLRFVDTKSTVFDMSGDIFLKFEAII